MGQELTVVQQVRQHLTKMQPEFRAVLPAHVSPEAFTRVAQTAIQFSEQLQECTTKSLIAACTKLAETGLQPDGVEAAIVAYNVKVKRRDPETGRMVEEWEKQAKAMPMVAGIRDLVRRSGQVKDWKVRLVRAADFFEHIDGDEERLVHRPSYDDESPITHVYSIAYLESGELSRHVMTIGQVDKIRRRSRTADMGPWVTDYEEMAKKTCLRQHSKALPKAKDDLQRERFIGALKAIDDAEDVLQIADGRQAAAALPAPALSMHEAARRRMNEAVELSALDTPAERDPAPIAETPAPKAARKRKTADERLAEAEAGKTAKQPPAASQAPQEPKHDGSPQAAAFSEAVPSASNVQYHPGTKGAHDDEARDHAYEAEQRENPEPEFGRETAEQDEPEIEAFRDGWRSRKASKTRVPPRTITSQDVAQAWIAGYDAFQKTVDIGNAPKTVDASEAMLSRMIDKQFA